MLTYPENTKKPQMQRIASENQNKVILLLMALEAIKKKNGYLLERTVGSKFVDEKEYKYNISDWSFEAVCMRTH